MIRKILSALLILCILGCCCGVLAQENSSEETATSEETALPKGFVRVTTSTQTGWLPLPVEGEYSYPLVQVYSDGTQVTNTVHLMPDGFYMESSDCDNQNCVEEGMVTLDNRETRILGNAVICLPHQLALELFSLEEVLEMTGAEQ